MSDKMSDKQQNITVCIQRIITNKCISEGLMHVAAWYRVTRRPKFTKFGE